MIGRGGGQRLDLGLPAGAEGEGLPRTFREAAGSPAVGGLDTLLPSAPRLPAYQLLGWDADLILNCSLSGDSR